MTARELFCSLLDFRDGCRTLRWEFGYWGGTLERWYGEGLPRMHGTPPGLAYGHGIGAEALDHAVMERDRDVHEYLGLDPGEVSIPVNLSLLPEFEERIVEDEGPTILVTDGFGVTKRERKDRGCMPEFIGWPVKDEETWEHLKRERLSMESVSVRVPLDEIQAKLDRHPDCPRSIGGNFIGFFGFLRILLGEVRLFLAFYDQPELIHAMNRYLAEFWLAILEPAVRKHDVDCVRLWEDMAGVQGPLISREFFREFLAPYYRILIGGLRRLGIRHFIVDSDGDCRDLIPLWMECGVTGLLPNEVQAGMDVVELRKSFPSLQLFGGIDKKRLTRSKGEIDQELDRVEVMLRQGGYLPFLDHFAPPDIPWENFCHYRRSLNRRIMGGATIWEA